MLCMIGAVAVLAGMDAALKALSQHYSPFQVTAMRGMASLPFTIALLLRKGQFGQLMRVHFRWHLLRGVIAVITLVTFIYALHQLSLADAYCIFFIAPVLITALSVPFLHEQVDWQRWLAIFAGLAGVIWMLKPGAQGWVSWGALAALVAAIGYALSAISLRIVGRTDSAAASTFWFLALVALGAGILAAPHWQAIQQVDWPWLLAVGLSGAIGQHYISEAFRLAPAGVVAPFEYTALIWGILLDFLVWGTPPNTGMWGGAAVVVGSGLFMLWREQKLHLAATMVSPDIAPENPPEVQD